MQWTLRSPRRRLPSKTDSDGICVAIVGPAASSDASAEACVARTLHLRCACRQAPILAGARRAVANAQHSQLQRFPDERGPARVRRLHAVRRCAIQPGRSRWSTHHHALSLPLQYSQRSTWQVVRISAVLRIMRLCPTRIVNRHRHR
ncbi:hypothetical protein VWR14_21985, partial [Xanthomonas citri pv. citri]